jgi:hypothetical protein
VTEVAGPPRTPFERARRRRLLVASTVAILLTATAVVLRVGGPSWLWADAPSAETPDGERSSPGGGPADGADPTTPPDDAPGVGDLATPSLEGLTARDRTFAALLIDVDASERAMLDFDDRATTALRGVDPQEPASLDSALATVGAAAARAVTDLDAIRARLVAPEAQAGGDPDLDAIGSAYVAHLDAWRTYLAGIAERPARAITDGANDTDMLLINVTADAFRRALEARLPADVDPEVRVFAEAILDRGFRGVDGRVPDA